MQHRMAVGTNRNEILDGINYVDFTLFGCHRVLVVDVYVPATKVAKDLSKVESTHGTGVTVFFQTFEPGDRIPFIGIHCNLLLRAF